MEPDNQPSIGRKNGQKLCDLGVNVRLCACMPALTPNPLSHQKNLAKITNIFDIQQRSTGLIARKVFSSNLAHISTCSCSSWSIFNLRASPTSEIRHRDPIYSHLIWVCIAIGLHSFSLYCHNDTLEALGRPEDIFHDNSIQLKAIFAKQSFLRAELQPDIEMLDKKIIRITQELGTADFIVHHIHAFHLV